MVDLRSLEVIDIVVCLLLGSKLEADAFVPSHALSSYSQHLEIPTVTII